MIDERWLIERTALIQLAREMRQRGYGVANLTRLKDKALRARSNMDKLHNAYDAFNAKAESHASELDAMNEQVSDMAKDLDFAVTTLGNSSGE